LKPDEFYPYTTTTIKSITTRESFYLKILRKLRLKENLINNQDNKNQAQIEKNINKTTTLE
jgi:hypothetical protein